MNTYGTSQDQTSSLRHQAPMRVSKLLALCLLASSSAALTVSAETYERIQPKVPGDDGIMSVTPKEGVVSGDRGDSEVDKLSQERLDTVLLENLKGLAFVSSKAEVRASGLPDVLGVIADESLQVLSSKKFNKKVASKYLGQPLTLKELNALNREVVSYLRAHGFPVVDVIVPEQDITSGAVQLIVLKGTVGDVSITGNEFFSTELLTSELGTTSGEVITAAGVLNDLNWINRNPFRNVNLLYSRGDDFSETDLEFQVQDRRPVRFYAGYENSGTSVTDVDRLLAGVNWGNVFGIDHQLNYQFTMAQDTSDFYGHSGSYIIPLPWHHVLSFYGSYSNSTAEFTSDVLEVDGDSYTIGARYTVPLKSTKNFNHELFGGFEYKYSKGELSFAGITQPETEVEVGQFLTGYSASLRDKWGSTNMSLTGFYSPGGLFAYNDDDDFDKVSYDANSEYLYGILSIERLTRLPSDFSLLTSVTGQLSDENLLISEQLGAGGYATVRGYRERVANAEQGIITTVELRSPTFSVTGHKLFGNRLPGDQLQLLTFWDYAQLDRKDPDDDLPLPKSFSLSSMGVGARYSMTERFSLRFDYGWQIKDSAVGDSGDSRGHVGLIFSY